MRAAKSFADRYAIERRLFKALWRNFWSQGAVRSYGVLHARAGFEYGIGSRFLDDMSPGERASFSQIVTAVSRSSSETAAFLRHWPDSILANEHSGRVILVDYKVSRTPRWSSIDHVHQNENLAQVAAGSWKLLRRLKRGGIDVAVLLWIPYHSRPLLFEEPASADGRDDLPVFTVRSTDKGSGLDYVKPCLAAGARRWRTFFEFMAQESLRVPIDVQRSFLGPELLEEWALRDKLLSVDFDPSDPNAGRDVTESWEIEFRRPRGEQLTIPTKTDHVVGREEIT